jgi:hypothetical protein
MHGEKQHILPSILLIFYLPFFKIALAFLIASQGLGTSKNKASA